MIYKKQPRIEHNFIDMNGNKWPHQWVNAYNMLTDAINKSAGINIKSDSLTQKERDFLLDQRHKQYVVYCELANNN
jgi:hypothetical protein